MKDQHTLPGTAEAQSLHFLLEYVESREALWTEEDLNAILSHQMDTPLSVDLGALRGQSADRVEQMAHARGLTLKSFGDLFLHRHPPVELLVLTKEFAKRNLASPESSLPKEVAQVLYFGSIALARYRCGESISRLSKADIQIGVEWCLDRHWVKEDLRTLLAEAVQ